MGNNNIKDCNKSDDKIKIPNHLFKDYCNIHETVIRIILLLLAYEKRNDLDYFTTEDICKYTDISKRTFAKYSKKVIGTGIIYIKNKCKNNSSYKYGINHNLYADGFTLIDSKRIINIYFERTDPLSNTEAKLYFFLYQMIKNKQKENCNASQEYIGSCIGKSRTRTCELTDILELKSIL